MSETDSVQTGIADFDQRLLRIECRLERVERHLHMEEAVMPPNRKPPPLPLTPVADLIEQLNLRRRASHDTETSKVMSKAPAEIPSGSIARQEPDDPIESAVTIADPPARSDTAKVPIPPIESPLSESVLPYESRPEPISATGSQSPLEQIIGLKLAGWVGAIVLVIGAGLGIKYLYDIHFFAGVSPAVWLSLLSLIGLGLIGAGEYVYRKINTISATGLFGAGVAALFLVSYAGHAYYGLYQQSTAFVLMAMSALVGAGVAMRGKLVSIGALSLIGGLLAPLVLHGDSGLLVPFLMYLMALQLVALVLAWWGASDRWWTLRGVSLCGNAIWIGALLVRHPDPWGACLVFTLLMSALYQLELILSARRPMRDSSAQSTAGVTLSVVVTALMTGAILCLFHDAAAATRGIWVASVALIELLLGILLTRPSEESARMKALAYGYRAQSAVLLLLAVPITFGGATISIAWAGMALAMIAIGSKLNDRAARITGAIAWGLAVINLARWASDPHHLEQSRRAWLTIMGQPIVAWMVIGWGISAIGQAMAWLIARRDAVDEHDRAGAVTMSGLATGLFAIISVMGLPPLGSTAVLLGFAWVLCGAEMIAPRLAPLAQGAAVLGLIAAKWVVVDTLLARMAPDWSPGSSIPVLNPQTLLGIIIAGSMVGMHRLSYVLRGQGKKSDANDTAVCIAMAALLVVLWAGTMEIDRLVAGGSLPGLLTWPRGQVRQLAWTAWWTAGLIGFLTVACLRDGTILRRLPAMRAIGFALLLIAIKHILLDALARRIFAQPAPAMVLMNIQTFCAAVVFASLLLVRHFASAELADARLGDGKNSAYSSLEFLIRAASALAVALLLVAGSLEIDRAFHRSAILVGAISDPALAEQVALSIFWSAFAIGCVVAGFGWRIAGLRYFGLALFALTLLKIGVLDLRDAQTGYRILSFMALGALLLVTSVVYGKLTPRLLGEDADIQRR